MSQTHRNYPFRERLEPPAPIVGACWVQLTKQKWSLVDVEDYQRVIDAGRWAYNTNGYAYRRPRINKRQTVMMLHRFILGITDSRFDVDHINRDRLDNRKVNLRICTRAENTCNSVQKGGASRYKGVATCRYKWRALIKINYKQIHLGVFNTEEGAARAYDTAAREYFGEYALLNFGEQQDKQQ